MDLLTRTEYYAQIERATKSGLSHVSMATYDEYVRANVNADEGELYSCNNLELSPYATMYVMEAISKQIDEYESNGWEGTVGHRHLVDAYNQILDFPTKGNEPHWEV